MGEILEAINKKYTWYHFLMTTFFMILIPGVFLIVSQFCSYVTPKYDNVVNIVTICISMAFLFVGLIGILIIPQKALKEARIKFEVKDDIRRFEIHSKNDRIRYRFKLVDYNYQVYVIENNNIDEFKRTYYDDVGNLRKD